MEFTTNNTHTLVCPDMMKRYYGYARKIVRRKSHHSTINKTNILQNRRPKPTRPQVELKTSVDVIQEESPIISYLAIWWRLSATMW